VSSKPGRLSVPYIQRMNIIIVDFIKIRSKNLVIKANLSLALCMLIFHQKSGSIMLTNIYYTHQANLSLALCMLNFSPKIRLDYAYKYTLYS